MRKLIGMSLSFCVRDIVNQKVHLADVTAIVSSTMIERREHLDDVAAQYAVSVWASKPTECRDTALTIYESGMLIQPRIFFGIGLREPGGAIWIDAITNKPVRI